MDIVSAQFNASFVNEVKIKPLGTKPHSKAEIMRALNLLGFNSWTTLEPSMYLYSSSHGQPSYGYYYIKQT